MKLTDLLKLISKSNLSPNSYDILDKGFVKASDGYLVVKEQDGYALYYVERGQKELLQTAPTEEKIYDAFAEELNKG